MEEKCFYSDLKEDVTHNSFFVAESEINEGEQDLTFWEYIVIIRREKIEEVLKSFDV